MYTYITQNHTTTHTCAPMYAPHIHISINHKKIHTYSHTLTYTNTPTVTSPPARLTRSSPLGREVPGVCGGREEALQADLLVSFAIDLQGKGTFRNHRDARICLYRHVMNLLSLCLYLEFVEITCSEQYALCYNKSKR